MPEIDIDRDAAHDAAQRELAKPVYPKRSPTQRFHEWAHELLYRLVEKGSSIPGGWFILSALLTLLIVAVVIAIRVARRTMRTHHSADYQLFDTGQLSAAQHRTTAEGIAAEGNWTAAIRHRLRAIARGLEETRILNPAPGRTANELARDAGAYIPHLASELSQAATAFNDVSYGEQPGTPPAYQMIVDLDDHLRVRSVTGPPRPNQPAPVDSWTPGPMTIAGAPTTAQRSRSWRWVLLVLAAICAVAAIGAFLTAPRPGGQMDPAATGPEGVHALVTLLRDRGVTIVVANTVTDVENTAGPGTLLLIAQTQHITNELLLQRLAGTPGDLLLMEPTSRARAALAPGIRTSGTSILDNEPNCVLREANRAGSVEFGPTNTFDAVGDRAITSCYGGALVRYRDDKHTVTVVGSTNFMTNGSLLRAGNAALAMNLAGNHPRLVWYAPQRVEGESFSSATIFDLIPANVNWIVWQLWLTVMLVALWKGRRVGPLVAEDLPVAVRASETVEGRGRLYRSRRARDRAAQALRVAMLQRLLTRLELGADISAPAVVSAAAHHSGGNAEWVRHILYGPPPTTDADLVHLARALDDIERQIAHS